MKRILFILLIGLLIGCSVEENSTSGKEIPNKKQKYLKIFKDDKWILEDKNERIPDIIDKNYFILDSHYGDNGGNEKLDKRSEPKQTSVADASTIVRAAESNQRSGNPSGLQTKSWIHQPQSRRNKTRRVPGINDPDQLGAGERFRGRAFADRSGLWICFRTVNFRTQRMSRRPRDTPILRLFVNYVLILRASGTPYEIHPIDRTADFHTARSCVLPGACSPAEIHRHIHVAVQWNGSFRVASSERAWSAR